MADTWVRVDCVRCGSVSLRASDVRLVMAGAESDDARDTVAFRCRRCGHDGAVLVDERAARLVASAGAAVTSPVEDAAIDRAPGGGPRPTR